MTFELLAGMICGCLFSGVFAYFLFKLLTKNQREEFKQLASEVLGENAETLNLTVREYKEYLDQMHKFDLKDREGLKERLTQMIESAGKIEKETGNLSQALKSDVKFQGAWGELTLERVLELSGLVKNQEYFTQEVFKSEDGKPARPDVIVKLPGDSHFIIDSKVSLKAYFDYMNSENKELALKELKKSVQIHIDQLSKKNYQVLDGLQSPDFVYMFVPVEGVYSLILHQFPEIIDDSLKKEIVLVSPMNIVANLKTVASLWRLDKQSKHATDMAQKAGAMYDKFASLVDDFHKVETHLKRAQDSQQEVMKKLSEGKGNLLVRAQELKSLGAKTSKTLNSDILN